MTTKSWRINELGLPWEKCLVEDIVLPDVPEQGCRVQVEATDLNFADILQCEGKYQVKGAIKVTSRLRFLQIGEPRFRGQFQYGNPNIS
ncbi:MAG: hypothetical protein NZ789_20190 [Pseudomonadales bacterium]|nr:hypothetical protein [Pseudomonadales bacterium]